MAKRNRKIILLRFEDDPDIEIYCRSASVGKFIEVAEWADKMQAGQLGIEGISQAMTWLAGRIISWNIEDDDGKPIPVSKEYLLDEDIDFQIRAFMGWVTGVSKSMSLPEPETAATGPDPAAEAAAAMSTATTPETPDSASGM